MISQAMRDHVSTFQLISDKDAWLQRYESLRGADPSPYFNQMDKENAILHATFGTLANADQLRIKRFGGYTGLGDDRQYYHEIQVLDQKGQVATTLMGVIPEADMSEAVFYLKSPIVELPNYVSRIYDSVSLIIVLPIEFPNYPEFRDENGEPLDCGYNLHFHSYNPIRVWIRKEFITDVFITKEMRNETIKKCTMEQCKKIKEELMINRWHPKRVECLLELGYEIEDM